MPWTLLWIVWFLIFVVVEGAAIYGKRVERDTLSQNLQWLFVKDRPKWWRNLTLCLWAAFAVWFGWHIWID